MCVCVCLCVCVCVDECCLWSCAQTSFSLICRPYANINKVVRGFNVFLCFEAPFSFVLLSSAFAAILDVAIVVVVVIFVMVLSSQLIMSKVGRRMILTIMLVPALLADRPCSLTPPVGPIV